MLRDLNPYNLKVPIQFEIELQGMGNQKCTSSDELDNQGIENITNAVDTNANLVINEINKLQVYEQLEDLSNKLFSHILKENGRQLLTDNDEFQLPLNHACPQFYEEEESLTELLINNNFPTDSHLQNQQENDQKNKYTQEDEPIEEKLNEEKRSVKKRKVRFADSLNDSLTLAVNCVGAVLLLGKLANYSWE
ncbi:hypothetical protein NIES4101_66660 [Calothrix sp. NIES-4101]|nr:hypothetical protein NIES4101_66660 [Calothrix sp. NIES-4101]